MILRKTCIRMGNFGPGPAVSPAPPCFRSSGPMQAGRTYQDQQDLLSPGPVGPAARRPSFLGHLVGRAALVSHPGRRSPGNEVHIDMHIARCHICRYFKYLLSQISPLKI